MLACPITTLSGLWLRAPSDLAVRALSEATDRLALATSALAEHLPLRELGQLTLVTERAATDIDDQSAGISPLTGEQLPATSDIAAAHLRNLYRAFADRHRLLADAIGAVEVAELLGVGRQTPHDRLRAQTLLAVKDRGQWRFPSWQFDSDGPDGVVPGLPEALRALRGPISDLGRVRWFVTPKASLDDRAPIDALHSGDVDDVVVVAEALGAS